MLFIETATQLSHQILEQAEHLDDGSLTWGRGAGRDEQATLDSGPFNGRCGEALLFAAAYKTTGDARFFQATHRTLHTLTTGIPDPGYRTELADSIVFGLAGLGGILYALVRAGQLTQSADLLERARQLTEVITPERIDEDGLYDIIWGSAGALLGLLAVADLGDDNALRKARLCADHLLACRTTDPESGLRAWKTLRKVPSTSFAHGASGMAHALLALHQRTGTPEFYDAAIEAFDFERSLFSEDHQNWSDSRRETEFPPMWSWCHGATGIGLARLSILDTMRPDDEGAIVADLRAALHGTSQATVPGVDQVCCGVFGRIEFLLAAGRKLGNPSLVRLATELARARIERAREHGFLLTPIDDVVAHKRPGFWQGITGTAYSLFRLADADAIPCALAMA